jgi:Domain of unknown function (DUF4926)
MTIAKLFQRVEINQDFPNSFVKKGMQGVVVDHLFPNSKQKELGYIVEVFENGETLDVISISVSDVTILDESWGEI